MKNVTIIVVVVVVLLIAGTGAFLATWEIPAPTKPAEVVIPNEKFPR
jgi:hypothetical protein